MEHLKFEHFYDGYRSFGGTFLSTEKPICPCNQVDHKQNNRRPYMGYKRSIHVILPCKLGGPYSRQYGIVAGEVAMRLLLSPSTSIFPCHCRSTVASYPHFIQLPSSLYYLSKLQRSKYVSLKGKKLDR